MKNLTKSLLAGTVVALTLSSQAALAQDEDATNNDVVSISQKPRPLYDPLGIRAGSFVIKPSIKAEEVFRSNIFHTQNNEIDDIISVVTPAVNISSDWNNHFVSLDASADIARYADNTDENYEDILIDAYGRYDVLRDTYLDLGIKYEEKHEERGSPDDTAGAKPTTYDVLTGTAGFSRKLRKISLEVTGEVKEYDFANTNGTDNSGRDRTQSKVTTKIGYEIIPNYEAFIRASYDVRKYDNTTALDRDSDGYDVVVGTEIDITGKVKGSVYAGYMDRSIDATTLKDVNDVKFGGDILWNPTGLTSVFAGIDRTIEETSIATSSAYVATTSSVSVEHELHDNIILNANVSFSKNEYEGGTGTQREDDILSAGVGVKYLLNRNVHLSAGYNYETRDSNIVNAGYDDNKVMLRLTLSY